MHKHIMYSSLVLLLFDPQAHNGFGELAGRSAPPVDKLFGVLTSLGNVAFAYNSCVVMVEIQVSPACCCCCCLLTAGASPADRWCWHRPTRSSCIATPLPASLV